MLVEGRVCPLLTVLASVAFHFLPVSPCALAAPSFATSVSGVSLRERMFAACELEDHFLGPARL